MADPLDRYLAPSSPRAEPSADPLDDLLSRQRRETANANLVRDGIDPDRAGRANVLAREFGLPAETAERNLPALEVEQQRRTARDLAERYPAIGKWAADPRNAAVGLDDMPNLGRISEAWERRYGTLKATPAPAPTVRNFFRGVWESFVQGGEQAKAAGRQIMADLGVRAPRGAPGTPQINIGPDTGPLRAIERAQGRVEAATPAFRSATMRGVYSGVSSLAQTAPGIAMSVALRNPVPALAIAGGSTGLRSYGKYRVRGGTPGQAALGGAGEGAVEAVTELLPMKFAVSAFGRVGFGSFVGGLLGREVPGEQIATFAQDAIDTAIANPDKTWRQFLEERPGAAYETFVATVTQALATGGPAALARHYSRHQAAQTAEQEAGFLNELVAGATAAAVRERDPEAFRRFLDLHSEGDGENLYVPSEAVRELFQSDTFDAGAFFEDYAEQVDEAFATGGDVVIPLSAAATGLAGTKAWEALKDEVRLSPGGLSRNEARSFDEALADEMATMGEQMAREQAREREALGARQKVMEAVRDALLRVGYAPDAAAAQGELYAAHYETMATAFGTDAFAEFQRAGLKIEQRMPEGLRRVQAADAVDIVAAAMRRSIVRGSGRPAFGSSLLEFLASRGGIEDVDGDLASMGADAWHKGKPFRKKLVRPKRDASPALLPGDVSNENTPDAMALAAWEAGYFPEFGERRPTVDDLYEAIGSELRGTPRYADDRTSGAEDINAAADELFEILERQGLDAAKATNDEIRAAVAAYGSSDAEGRSYGQESEKRARITFTEGGAVIELFESRNLSSFIHETGHLWLEELWRNADRRDAPDWMRDAKVTVRKWFEENGHDLSGAEIPRDAHELWARSFERFALEGKAPSAALRKAFERFRVWLVAIYRSAMKLKAPITPEVWDVMERLLATEEELREAREQQRVNALFASAAEAGMTEAEFQAYSSTVEEARTDAYDALLKKTMGVIRASRTAEWKAEEAEVRAEVTKEVDARREFRVLAALKGKEPRVRLSTAWLVENYGEAGPSLIPQSVPPLHSDKDPVDADVLAEVHGFTSGDEMVRTLMGLEQRRKELREQGDKRSAREAYIDQATEEVMRARHGDPLASGSIEEEALAVIHNERQGDVISAELRVLGRRMGQKPTPYKLAREWAARKIATGTINETASGAAIAQYSRAAAKAGKEAEVAIREGNPARAFNLKQIQLLNSALIAEARKARDVTDTAATRLAKLARRPTMAGVDQDYMDQVHALLEAYDFKPRSQVAVAERENFWRWIEARADEGLEMNVPPRLMANPKHFTKMTVEELQGLEQTVKQILHLGRLKRKLLKDKEQRDLDAIAGDIEGAVRSSRRGGSGDLRTRNTPGERWKSAAKGLLAMHRKAASLARQMDGGRDGGPLWQYFIKPMNECADTEAQMRAEATDKLKVLVKPLLAEGKMGGKGRYFPHLGISLNREERIGIVLNMGNAGNLQRLLDGEGWSLETLQPIVDSLSRVDMDFVQAVWDFFESYRPAIGAKERRVYGVEPDWVEPQTLATPHGVYRGGYYPIKYDPRRSSKAEQHADAEELKRQMRGAYTSATPRRSFAKARAEEVKGRPLLYNLSGLWQGVNEVIHDLAWHEWLLDANKLLKHRTIDSAMRQVYGPEAIRVFKKAQEDIAIGDVPAQNVFETAINHVRMGATVAGLGWNLKTALLQPFGLTQSIVRVGAPWIARGMVQWLKSPIDVVADIHERSTFMRLRGKTMQREINEIQNRVSGGKSALGELVDASFFIMIQKAQMIADVPTWLGAYEKAFAAGNSEERSIALADQAVRDAQGGGQVSDLSQIQRGGALQKLFTNFYSFFNVTYNLSAERVAATDFRSRGEVMRLALDFLLLYSVPATMGYLLAQAFGAGDDDDAWVGELVAENLSFLMGTMIGVREMTGAAQSAVGVRQYEAAYGGPAGLRFFQELDKSGKQVGQGEWDRAMRKSLVNSAGILFHLPSGQINRTWDGVEALANDETDNLGVLVVGAQK